MNNCKICNSEIPANRKICSKPECKSVRSRQTIQETFLRNGGEITRFRKTNGMHNPETRAKVSMALKNMGWKPTVIGGNGRGPTIHEIKLLSALGDGWKTNLIVNTNGGRKYGFPTHYKIDVGNPWRKIAIELDGMSHNCISRREQDLKKTNWLHRRGWTVLRFKNSEVENSFEAVLDTIRRIA